MPAIADGPPPRDPGRDRLAKYYEDRLSARAPFWMILLLQLAVPSEIPGYVLGSLRYRFPAYFLALALAELLAAVFRSSDFAQYWMMAVVGVVGIAFLAWAIRRLHRELEEQPRATREGKPASAVVTSTP